MVLQSNLKSYLSDPSRIFTIEAMETVLWLIKREYFILTHPVHGVIHSQISKALS